MTFEVVIVSRALREQDDERHTVAIGEVALSRREQTGHDAGLESKCSNIGTRTWDSRGLHAMDDDDKMGDDKEKIDNEEIRYEEVEEEHQKLRSRRELGDQKLIYDRGAHVRGDTVTEKEWTRGL